MNKYQISVPQDVPFAVIQAALANLGNVTIRPVISKAPKAEKTFQEPVIVYKNGEPVDEINGVEVQKRINKIMAEVNRQWDGRTKRHFTGLEYNSKDPHEVASEYIKQFCSGLSHVKTQYELNGSLVTA